MKFSNVAIFILLGLSMVFNPIRAQQQCGSEYNLELIRQHNPNLWQKMKEIEAHTQQYLLSQMQTKSVNDVNATITIPVVVHVLHLANEPVGTGRNIPDAQIQSQIDVLNEDFNRINADRVNTPAQFTPNATNANIQFRLACTDPNGNPTNGITRTVTSIANFPYTPNPDGTINETATRIKFTSLGGRDA
ncbi:MAG: hypothetical protein HC880_00020 [Bacteroidia bacterium]|nr:hypothetical protein [Bacteroidia bacterium]